jgi:hypothetical protein
MAISAGDPAGGGMGGGCWTFIAGLTVSAAALAALALYAGTHRGAGQQPGSASPAPATSARPPASPAVAAAAPAPCPPPGADAVFQSPSFPDADWTDSLVGSSTLSTPRFDVTRGPAGTGPDQRGYRATRLVFAGKGSMVVLHLQRAAVYDPARCGPISALDVSFSAESLGSAGSPEPQWVGFAIRQGGRVYWTPTANLSVTSPTWVTQSMTGLHQENFNNYVDFTTGHPDFAAGAVELGYATIARCAVGSNDPPCAQEETTTALAAWHVTVHR